MSVTIARFASVCGKRVAHPAEHLRSADRPSGRPAATRCATPDPAPRSGDVMAFRLAAHREMASPESTWLFRIGVELLMMSLTGPRLSLKSLAIAVVESTRRCNAGPRPPTAWDVSVSSASIFSFGSTARLLLAASSAGPTSLGTELLVMVVPGARYWFGVAGGHQVEVLLADRRHRVHVRGRVDRDLELAVDAHRRPWPRARWARRRSPCRWWCPGRSRWPWSTGRPNAAGRRTACTGRCPTTAGQPQVVPAQHDQRDERQDREEDQLNLDEAGQHQLTHLSRPAVRPARRAGSA